MQAPTIHLNGTSAQELRRGYKTAYLAVLEALDRLQETAPHMRDYYVAPEGSFEVARREHEARMVALDNVANELAELARACTK